MPDTTSARLLREDARRVLIRDLPWSTLDGKTVLVSGAAGMVPGAFVEVLLERNLQAAVPTQVVGLVRDLERARQRFAHRHAAPGFTLLQQDLCEPLCDVPRPDIVVHGASPASPGQFARDPIGTLGVNTLGTWQLLTLAEASEASFLYLSSGAVYGRLQPEQFPVAEDTFGPLDPLAPDACYGEGKRAGEALCAAWHRQRGLRTLIARIAHTYGPGLREEDDRSFAEFLFAARAGRNLVLRGNPEARRAFCYLSDTVAGLFTLLFRGAPGTACNVGNPAQECSIAALADQLAALAEPPVAVLRAPGPPDLASPVTRGDPDVTRLEALGWRAEVPLEEGFRRTLAYLRALKEPAP